MLNKLLITILMVSCGFVAQAAAQTETSISPEKHAAIRELIGLINVDNKADKIVEVFEQQMSGARAALITSVLDERADLTNTEKASLRDTLTAKQEEYTKRFREKLIEKLNYNQMVEEIGEIVYDKYYTLEEIRDLVAFYKTPTGQKSLKVMTPLLTDSLKLTYERMVPKIPVIMDELKNEEKVEMQKELNQRKPRAKKTASNN